MSINSLVLFDGFKLFSGVQGILFALVLLFWGDSNRLANRYLAVLLAIVGLMPIHRFMWGTGYIQHLPYFTDTMMLLGTLIPPTLYLYVRTMTQVETRPNWKWIIWPVLVIWCFQIPAHLAPLDVKVALVDNTYINRDLSLFLVVSFRIYVVLLQCLFFIFIALAFRKLFQHTRNIRHFFSYRENIELAWARNLLLVCLCFLIATLILYILLPFFGSGDESQTEARIAFMFKVTDVFFAIVLFYSGVMGLLQTRIYQPSVIKEQEFETILVDTGSAGVDKEKYQKSALAPEKAQEIMTSLLDVMDKERPYLESDLSLARLADLTGVSTNHLSQVINDQLQMSFFDFVNGYRVRFAQDLMATESRKTILDIATEAAFNSKSAFYSAFKKNTGLTPMQYRKDLQNLSL